MHSSVINSWIFYPTSNGFLVVNLINNYTLFQKGFSAKRAFQDHLASHSDKKDKICSLCKKEFKTQTKLNRHTKTVHKKWFCPFFKKKLKLLSFLQIVSESRKIWLDFHCCKLSGNVKCQTKILWCCKLLKISQVYSGPINYIAWRNLVCTVSLQFFPRLSWACLNSNIPWACLPSK